MRNRLRWVPITPIALAALRLKLTGDVAGAITGEQAGVYVSDLILRQTGYTEKQLEAAAVARRHRRKFKPRGIGGKKSTPFVVIAHESLPNRHELQIRVKLSRAAYRDLDTPLRIDVQQHGTRIALIPYYRGGVGAMTDGYAVVDNIGGVWITASGARDILTMEPGRYALLRVDGLWCIGERL